MTKTLLLEIGTEELPSSFVDTALAVMPELIRTRLESLRLSHGRIHALGTARRLAIVVHDVADRQSDLDELVVGPPETAAFKDGQPTKAAEAFAEKLGIAVGGLTVVAKEASGKQKAGRFVVGRKHEIGKPAMDLLGPVLADLCAHIPFRKSMRWGSGTALFGRPIQWIVALFGSALIDVSFASVQSASWSRGHRFLSPETFDIPSADAYIELLRSRHVWVDRAERAALMMQHVAEAAARAGGTHDPDQALVDENASLVEQPHVVTGTFDEAFLALPAAVIRAVARGHQKYFCVQKPDDSLLPVYLAVVNTANDPERIAKGNNRVMRARLADAMFFYEEDKKANFEDRIAKLSGIVFHHRLGTVRDKVARLEKLATRIARAVHLPETCIAHVHRAAHVCKVDLVSLMVGEFPELQGEMGRCYALAAGEPADVADAVRDHYKPIGAEGAVASNDVATCVALADRLDTLVGCFAVGLSPTGAADPFALRRACIAILRTLLDRSQDNPAYAELSISELFTWAYEQFEGQKLDLSLSDTVNKVRDFALERLRGLVAAATSNHVADAVGACGDIDHPSYTLARAQAVHRAVAEGKPWLDKARTVAKRLAGISKASAPHFHPQSCFTSDTDAIVVDTIAKADASTKILTTVDNVTAALAQAEDLASRLDEIFTRTLVNDPADERTPKRLELLSYGAQCMLRIGDFSKLA